MERLTYDRENQQVSYQGKAETHTYQPLDFMACVSLHIPDKGEQIVRYYVAHLFMWSEAREPAWLWAHRPKCST